MHEMEVALALLLLLLETKPACMSPVPYADLISLAGQAQASRVISPMNGPQHKLCVQ